jgi:cation/acetate symporter
MTVYAADVNELALSIFAVVVGVTLIITYVASKRVSSATDFWAAGRGLTGVQNGFAIAGDYMSAASFLGIAGLIFLFGFDGFLYSVGFLVAFLTVLFLLAERMRNSGKYTIADVLSFRMKETPARTAAALGTLSVVAFYLIAQMVGAGVLIQALVGVDFTVAVILTGAFMLVYVVAGGMLATSWVQIIKAVLLLTATFVLSIFVLGKIGWNPLDLFRDARSESPAGAKYLEPGLLYAKPIDTISLGLGLVLGTAGLPHILMRFFTVPDAKAARSSVGWAVGLIGVFYLMTTCLGFGARAILGEGATEAVGSGGNLAAPLLAEEVGGGAGTVGGDLFLAIIAAVAFATILAVVAGLVISASGAVAHDVWSNIVRAGRDSEREEVWVARLAAVGIGAIAIFVAILGGEGLNVSFMVGLAFAVAASANFPALLLALIWRRFNTTGAVTGVLFGVISSVGLVIISPTVWPGPDSEGGALSWLTLANPGIISIPLGFIGCWLGTMLSTEGETARSFDELYVRSETGLGAEVATGLKLTGGGHRPAGRAAAAATTIPTKLAP